ncbi:hypothetical protein B0H17DRAFT_1185891 [Mycena rosella]|uniref:Uncharacterized protein n=1 Tax=Mycena rosella TaxID=1033263 RepID=A0AAD7CPI0_MYCRO|nr:hypothetical protein B0H17DRAFT_1185891 [Mycena rosella]
MVSEASGSRSPLRLRQMRAVEAYSDSVRWFKAYRGCETGDMAPVDWKFGLIAPRWINARRANTGLAQDVIADTAVPSHIRRRAGDGRVLELLRRLQRYINPAAHAERGAKSRLRNVCGFGLAALSAQEDQVKRSLDCRGNLLKKVPGVVCSLDEKNGVFKAEEFISRRGRPLRQGG